MEGVRWIATVGARIAQRPGQIEVFEDGHRPAVRTDQRQRVGLGRAHVEEVHSLAVNGRRELRIAVQPRLVHAPVEARAPVGDELADVVTRNAVAPLHTGQLVRPADPLQPGLEIFEVGLGDLDAVWAQACARGNCHARLPSFAHQIEPPCARLFSARLARPGYASTPSYRCVRRWRVALEPTRLRRLPGPDSGSTRSRRYGYDGLAPMANANLES